ncbi:hypothetical protein QN224_30370 [Sinorhizobium sp. 8-89]|uniref:hypothetical protein n=1 Tax=Sinorhizobium sp. 7-81 TaxID=3049087 RepID=UPI0024C2E2C2|nr:hypothetical protein [Sinorhizobium sp. 7-81]MDK1389671.1 hypothetical protein [Sinorhizobium sp. 7-81]
MTYLKRELSHRFLTPMGHFTFWVYLFVGIVFFGGFGVWYEVIPFWFSRPGSTSAGIYTALLTFFPALAGSSALQLLFAEGQKPLKAFSVAYAVVFIALAVWLGFAKPSNPIIAFTGATIGALLAILMWWLTSGNDPAFNDAIDDRSTLGADPKSTPKGDLNGFEV